MKIINLPIPRSFQLLNNSRFHLTTTDNLPLIVDTLSGHKLGLKNEKFGDNKICVKEALILEEDRAILLCKNHPGFSHQNCVIVLVELNVRKGIFKELVSFKGPRVGDNFKYTRLIADQLDRNKFICYNPRFQKFFCFEYSPSKSKLYHLKNIVVHIHRPLTCLRLCSEALCGFFYENVMSTRRFQILDFNLHVPHTYKTNISQELLKTVLHSMTTTKFKRIGSRAKKPALDPIPYTELYSWIGDCLFVVANLESTIILLFDSMNMIWLGPIIKLQRPINFLQCLDLGNLLLNDGKENYKSAGKSNGFNVVSLRTPNKLIAIAIRTVINTNQINNLNLPSQLQIQCPF